MLCLGQSQYHPSRQHAQHILLTTMPQSHTCLQQPHVKHTYTRSHTHSHTPTPQEHRTWHRALRARGYIYCSMQFPKTNTHTHADSDGEAHEPRARCVWVFLRVWTHSYHCPTGKRQDCSGRTGGWTQVPLCLEGHYGGKGSRVLEIKDHTVTVTCQAESQNSQTATYYGSLDL